MPMTPNALPRALHTPSRQTLTTLHHVLSTERATIAHFQQDVQADGIYWVFSTWAVAPIWQQQSRQQTFRWNVTHLNAATLYATLAEVALEGGPIIVLDGEAFLADYAAAFPFRSIPEVTDMSVLFREVLGQNATNNATENFRMVADLTCQEHLIHGALLWGDEAQTLNYLLHVLAHQHSALKYPLPGQVQAQGIGRSETFVYQVSYPELTHSIASIVPFISPTVSGFRKVFYAGEHFGSIMLGLMGQDTDTPSLTVLINCSVNEAAGQISLSADFNHGTGIDTDLFSALIAALDQIHFRVQP